MPLDVTVGYVVPFPLQLIEHAPETVVPRLGEITPGEVAEVGEVERPAIEVEPAAQVVVESLRQAYADALVHICLYPAVIASPLTYSRDSLYHLNGEGWEVGVKVLFPVTVHPVVLPWRIGEAYRRCEVVEGSPSGCRYPAVKGKAGFQAQSVSQFDAVAQVHIIVVELVMPFVGQLEYRVL